MRAIVHHWIWRRTHLPTRESKARWLRSMPPPSRPAFGTPTVHSVPSSLNGLRPRARMHVFSSDFDRTEDWRRHFGVLGWGEFDAESPGNFDPRKGPLNRP